MRSGKVRAKWKVTKWKLPYHRKERKTQIRNQIIKVTFSCFLFPENLETTRKKVKWKDGHKEEVVVEGDHFGRQQCWKDFPHESVCEQKVLESIQSNDRSWFPNKRGGGWWSCRNYAGWYFVFMMLYFSFLYVNLWLQPLLFFVFTSSFVIY